MVATSGSQLLPAEALKSLREKLLPRATVLTPNIPEARLLLADAGQGDAPINRVEDLEVIGRAVHALGPRWVLVKGGHCPFRRDGAMAKMPSEKEIVVDVLVGGGDHEVEVIRVETPYYESRNTHGTGCSLACKSIPVLVGPRMTRGSHLTVNAAAAIASNIAKGMSIPQAVKTACRYVEAAIRTAPGLGGGNGPLNHFHSVYTLPFAPYARI